MRDSSHALLRKVRRIAVLRPNAVGDFVFALPALHALRHTYPEAQILYIGRQWHADFLAHRPGPVDKVLVLPPCPGVGMPPDADVDQAPVERFIAELRAADLDVAIQLYGGGRYSNPFVQRLGARMTIGMKAADAPPLDRWVAFDHVQNRRLQLLGVTALIGANMLRLGQELQVTEQDREEAGSAVPPDERPLVMLQPGSTDIRRCWSPERFAAIGDLFAEQGAQVAVNGTAAEAPIVRAVLERMRRPALDLSGRLSLSGLCGLLERTALLVSNDTGPLHLGLAIGTPCVGIYWLTNRIESGPLRQDGQRSALSLRTHCPVCGAENLKTRCAHDVSFVDDVPVDEVAAMALDLYRNGG